MQTLGIFAKEPVPGRVKTRLAENIGPGPAAAFAAAALSEICERCALLADDRLLGFSPTTESARSWFAGLSAERYQLWPQPSGSLGDRIEAFFAMALSRGPAADVRAVLIGSDSPNLPPSLISGAFAALHERDVVLGPTADGGYYLIGTRVPLTGWLNDVRWSSPWTLSDTVAAVGGHQASLAVLPPWYDVDTLDDLATLSGHLAAQRLATPESLVGPVEQWLQGLPVEIFPHT